jgi:hypothetical protein
VSAEPGQDAAAASAMDLEFLSILLHPRHRNFKSKTALESNSCQGAFGSESWLQRVLQDKANFGIGTLVALWASR